MNKHDFGERLLIKSGELAIAALAVSLPFTPLVAYGAPTDFNTLVKGILDISNTLVGFLVALAVIVIIWGTFRYLIASGDKERLINAKNVIVYGLLGVVVIYSIVGLVKILLDTVKFENTQPTIPQWK